VGKVKCSEEPTLSWRSDGNLYGGSGSAPVQGPAVRGCAAIIFSIPALLDPCCKPMADVVAGMSKQLGGLDDQAQHLKYLQGILAVRSDRAISQIGTLSSTALYE